MSSISVMETNDLTRLHLSFISGKSRPERFRRAQLKALIKMLRQHEAEFVAALHEDLHKPACEAFVSEIDFVVSEARHALQELAVWLTPQTVPTNLVNQIGNSSIRREPLGVALIMAPWNFPVQLALAPLVAAIAAGNCAMIKPSELAPACSALLVKLLPEHLDTDCYAVAPGGIEVAQELLAQQFDKIFFTGGAQVARIVMRAAAEHLTPVTLELGGKNACIVDEKVNLKVASKRIAWAKTFNAGQACVAVDYVLVHKKRYQELLERIHQHWLTFYGAQPELSPDLCHIINKAHFERLQALLKNNGTIFSGGKTFKDTLCITPTLLTDISHDTPIMQDEIFGPLLPVIPVDSVDEALNIVKKRPPALVLYLFSRRAHIHEHVLNNSSSGDVCINDAIAHYAVPELPFGGRGESGMGAYHGRYGFEAFSQARGVLRKSTLVDPNFRYPPYTKFGTKIFRKILGLG